MPHGPFFLFWLIIPTLCVILVFKLLRDKRRPDDAPQAMDEARMIQEMYRSLSRMEERIDVLESLLAEDGRSHGTPSDNARPDSSRKDG